jgi:hypothetical protein
VQYFWNCSGDVVLLEMFWQCSIFWNCSGDVVLLEMFITTPPEKFLNYYTARKVPKLLHRQNISKSTTSPEQFQKYCTARTFPKVLHHLKELFWWCSILGTFLAV